MTGRTFPEKVERGGVIANRIAALLFRLFVFVLFAPWAWRYLSAGDMPGFIVCAACAIGLGALLAPSD